MPIDRACADSLVAKALEGDKEAMAELVSMAAAIAKAHIDWEEARRLRISGEDLVQEGLIGFVNALRTYSPEREASFRTYASVCIQNRIRTAMSYYRSAKSYSLSSAVSFDDSGAELVPDPQEIFSRWESSEIFRALLGEESELSALERSVVELRLKGRSYKQISAELGVSTKTVDNALSRVKKKIRR